MLEDELDDLKTKANFLKNENQKLTSEVRLLKLSVENLN